MLSGSFRTNSSWQPEAAVITSRHTVGENGLGFYRPAIISKSFKKCDISNDLDGTEDDELWDEHHNKSDTDSVEEGDKMYDDVLTHEQIQQIFNEDSDDDKCLGVEYIC